MKTITHILETIAPILGKLSLVFLLTINVGYAQNQYNDSILNWSHIRKLNVDDFNKEVVIDTLLINQEIHGLCNVSLDSYYIDDLEVFNVNSIFNKNGSYLRKTTNIQYVLQHEQLHFDILELYARKIRKELYEQYVKGNDIDIEIFDSIYYKWIDKYRKLNFKYDKETNHSINPKEQEEWNQKITVELKTLDQYSEENYIKLIDEL